jgi:hypothetical protein
MDHVLYDHVAELFNLGELRLTQKHVEVGSKCTAENVAGGDVVRFANLPRTHEHGPSGKLWTEDGLQLKVPIQGEWLPLETHQRE